MASFGELWRGMSGLSREQGREIPPFYRKYTRKYTRVRIPFDFGLIRS